LPVIGSVNWDLRVTLTTPDMLTLPLPCCQNQSAPWVCIYWQNYKKYANYIS
jgi:hypothetical protein